MNWESKYLERGSTSGIVYKFGIQPFSRLCANFTTMGDQGHVYMFWTSGAAVCADKQITSVIYFNGNTSWKVTFHLSCFFLTLCLQAFFLLLSEQFIDHILNCSL